MGLFRGHREKRRVDYHIFLTFEEVFAVSKSVTSCKNQQIVQLYLNKVVEKSSTIAICSIIRGFAISFNVYALRCSSLSKEHYNTIKNLNHNELYFSKTFVM